jgi:hypothetical protein
MKGTRIRRQLIIRKQAHTKCKICRFVELDCSMRCYKLRATIKAGAGDMCCCAKLRIA